MAKLNDVLSTHSNIHTALVVTRPKTPIWRQL